MFSLQSKSEFQMVSHCQNACRKLSSQMDTSLSIMQYNNKFCMTKTCFDIDRMCRSNDTTLVNFFFCYSNPFFPLNSSKMCLEDVGAFIQVHCFVEYIIMLIIIFETAKTNRCPLSLN